MSLLLRVVPSSRVLARLPKSGVGSVRNATTTNAGEVLPMPHITRFGLFGIFCTVVPGLLIGATISKKMANFLEENELFVPSDDDDDDD